MGETEDRLALELMAASARLSDLSQNFREAIREEKARLKATLRELDEEGVIDLQRLVQEHRSRKAERRELLRDE